MREPSVMGRARTQNRPGSRTPSSRHGARGLRWLVTVPFMVAISGTPATATTASGPGALASQLKHSSGVKLTGAGSTFDAPFFSAAFSRYHHLDPGVSVSYAAVGSGDGIKRFSSGTVDFGASDVPMTPAEQAVARGPVVQVPVDLGAVVVSYNLGTGVPLAVPLRLTGPVLARIYLGQITKWDDPAIKSLNPGAALPDEHINVVHRSDGSGTTYILTNYLSTVSPLWARGPGTSKSIKWPVGLGAKGSAGVAALLRVWQGSIGYFELSYAESQSLPYALIENGSGTFVPPFAANVAADASIKRDLSASNFSIVDEPGPESYPISGYSWALLYARQPSTATGTALVDLINWLTQAGQKVAGANYYVPLPANVQALAQATLKTLVGPSGKRLLR